MSLVEDNLVEPKYVDIGFASKNAVISANKSITLTQKLIFMKDCRNFLKATVVKLQAHSPFRHSILKGCACLDPDVILAEERLQAQLLDKVLSNLVELNRLNRLKADQYLSMCSRRSVQEELRTFKRSEDSLDVFLMNLCRIEKAPPELVRFIQLILCLSHGQASIERGFSINKRFLVENQKEQSLISQWLVKDHIRAVYAGDDSKCDISKKLILSARNAAARYKEANKMSQEKRIASERMQVELKRKALELQEKESECKRLRLQLGLLEDDISKLKK